MSSCFFESQHCAGPLTRGYCRKHLQGCYERARWDKIARKDMTGGMRGVSV